MNDLSVSRRSVTRAIVALPALAASPALALTKGASSEWQIVKANYRAADAEFMRMIDVLMAAEDNMPPFLAPQPIEPANPMDGMEILDMTVRQIRSLPVDHEAWDAYKAAKDQWHVDKKAWDEKQIGTQRKAYDDAYAALSQSMEAIATCRVHSADHLADKIALGAEIFGNIDGIEADDRARQTYFARLTEDATTLLRNFA